MSEAYRLFFGVNDESLQQVAQTLGTSLEEYRAAMKSQDLLTVLSEKWTPPSMYYKAASSLHSVLNYFWLLGDPVAQHLREGRHRYLLEGVAKDTKNILRDVLTDSTV